MDQVGETLRQAREAKGLSLEQVEETTRIRRAYLQALENGDYGQLPAPVYVRGFIRNYAVYLGIDPRELLSSGAGPEQPPASQSFSALLNEPLEPLGRRITRPLALLALLAAVLLAAWWGLPRYLESRPTPTLTPAPAVELPTGTAEPSATPIPPTATATPTATTAPSATPVPSGLQLIVEIVGQRSWLLVQADGERAFAGILEPGTTRSWTAEQTMYLRSGVANAVRVTLNGQDLGLFGPAADVFEQTWTLESLSAPSPTATPSR